MTIPAGLLMAGVSTQSQAAVPGALFHSTTRIALGFMSGNVAAVLARGVLNSMLLNKLKVVSALVLLAVGSSYCAWLGIAAAIDDSNRGDAASRQAVEKRAVASSKPQPEATSPFRLTGTVTAEETGAPVAGAKLEILLGEIFGGPPPNEKIAETGADGRFTVDLPAGNARIWLRDPPAGYLVSNIREAVVDVVVGPGQPVINREFRVRRGTIWNFQFSRGADPRPFPGFVSGINSPEPFRAQADDRGRAQLTLPTEGRKVTLGVRESSPESTELHTGLLNVNLEWEPNFQPDELDEISLMAGNDRRFRLVDTDAKSAILQAPDSIEPIKENGKLVIRVAAPSRDSQDFVALTGQVLDAQGRPIAGARVALWTPGTRVSSEPRHQATTESQGRYRLRDIPRRAIDGQPLQVRLRVTKEGYAGLELTSLALNGGLNEKPQAVDPIRLERGVALSGVVVDHRGRPMAGAWVRSSQVVSHAGFSGTDQSTQTDEHGRFSLRDLRRDVTHLFVFHGSIRTSNFFSPTVHPRKFTCNSPSECRIPAPILPALRGGPPPPIAVGQPAAEWQVGPWSDGRARKLADERGKVVVLYFWGISFSTSVNALPALGKLAGRFEPLGVEFLAIHNAELDPKHAQVQARKLLEFKSAPLVMAIDQIRVSKHARGLTADRYGLRGYPVVIVIDRAGKIAFRSDTTTGPGNLTAVFTQMLQNSRTMTEAKANELIERTLAEEIEKTLKQKD